MLAESTVRKGANARYRILTAIHGKIPHYYAIEISLKEAAEILNRVIQDAFHLRLYLRPEVRAWLREFLAKALVDFFAAYLRSLSAPSSILALI